jgi:hypothetical protein
MALTFTESSEKSNLGKPQFMSFVSSTTALTQIESSAISLLQEKASAVIDRSNK